MAFSEADRVKIRSYLGYAQIFLQADPRLESAMTAVQSIADGGTRPDNSAELYIKAIVVDLESVDTRLKSLHAPALATKADDVSLDVPRARAMLCAEGRRIVNRLSVQLDTRPQRDVFGPAPLGGPLSAAAHMAGYEG